MQFNKVKYFILLILFLRLNMTYSQSVVQWKNTVGCVANGSILSKTITGSTYNAGANSENVLPIGQDGWAQFTIAQLGQKVAFGFSQIDGGTSLNSIEYAFETNTNNKLKIYTSGVLLGTFGTNKIGDVLRIERKSNAINFYNNNVLLKTVALLYNTNPFMIDVSLGTQGSSITTPIASFIKPLTINPIITDINSLTGALGSIDLNISGGVPSYKTSIFGSNIPKNFIVNGSIIPNLEVGTYDIIVSDQAGSSIKQTITIANKIDWVDSIGVNVTDSSLIKTTGLGSWTDAGAYTLQDLKANESGKLIHKITALNNKYAIGLHNTSVAKTGYHYTKMEYSFVISNKSLLIYKKNKLLLRFSTKLAIGDELVLEKNNNDIIFSYNGTKLYATTEVTAYGVCGQVSLFNPTAELKHIRTTFVRPFRIFYTQQDINCILGKKGIITVKPSGGLAPYIYTIDGKTFTKGNIFESLNAGDYQLTVQDNNNRKVTTTVSLLNCPIWSSGTKGVTTNVNGDIKGGFDSWESPILYTSEPFAFSDTTFWVSFTTPDTSSVYMLGFRSLEFDSTAQTTNYKLLIQSSIATIIETDNDGFYNKRQIKQITKDMGFKVQLTKTGIEYYTRINSTSPYQLEYTSKLFSNSKLIIESNIYKMGSTIGAIRVSSYGNTTIPIQQ